VIIRNIDSATEERTVGALRVHDAPETALTRILVDAAGDRRAASGRGGAPEAPRPRVRAPRGARAHRATHGEGALTPLASVSPPGAQAPVISRRVLERVMVQGEALSLRRPARRPGAPRNHHGRRESVDPLRAVGDRAAVLGRALPRHAAHPRDFKPTHLEVVATLAGMANVVLETARGASNGSGCGPWKRSCKRRRRSGGASS